MVDRMVYSPTLKLLVTTGRDKVFKVYKVIGSFITQLSTVDTGHSDFGKCLQILGDKYLISGSETVKVFSISIEI